MDNPGPFQLATDGGAFQIGAAGRIIGDSADDFEGLLAAALQLQFTYGSSGGTSVTAYIQTSIDQGQNWFDVAAVQFGTASGSEWLNLSALTPRTTPFAPTFCTLTPGTVVDGMLGDRLRAVVDTVGTYVGACALNITGMAR